jgi:Malectin domain
MNPFPHSRFTLLATVLLAFAVQCSRPALAAEPSTNAPAPAKPAAGAGTLRIIAGLSEPLKDEAGMVWQPTEGFADGQTINRPGTEIGRTKTPSVYCSERFGMSKFTQKLPNRKYTVKLHFAITYEGITEAGQCVFSVNVEGKEIKDLDVWEKAGGPRRAYVETVPVTVEDGQLDITFSAKSENPAISAIEIIPEP